MTLPVSMRPEGRRRRASRSEAGPTGRATDAAAEFHSTLASEAAFRVWYEEALPRVYGYLFERTGRVRSVAEELTQETFVDLVRSAGRFDGRSDPMTWAIAIARHKLADHFRRLAREERRRLSLVRDAVGASDDAWSASERRGEVLHALASVPALQRAALILHYMDDLTVAEVAAALGRSASAIESLLARGRDGLRGAISALDEGTDDD